MPISVQFLHSQPQRDVASLLTAQLTRCRSVAIIAGFVTPDGIGALTLPTPSHLGKLDRFVVGAGTYRAFEAIDQLIFAGAAPSVFRVHLGHSRMSGGHRNPFVRYHPMLHSKIYLFELDSGSTSAFVGSHNVTGFALRGFNGEAGVLLEGSSADPVFSEIRSHVDRAFAQATPYDPSMKEGYAWWTREFFDGLRAEANDTPKDAEPRKTVVIVAVRSVGHTPTRDDVVYFEIAEELSEIRSLDTEVHIHLFDTLPGSPSEALSRVHLAAASLTCRAEGLDVGRGSLEVDADWHIDDRKLPLLKRAHGPFRPATSAGMQQVRVRVLGPLAKRFDYLFDSGRATWSPEFNQEGLLRDGAGKGPWLPVKSLARDDGDKRTSKSVALLEASPESGSFILFSPRRRGRANV